MSFTLKQVEAFYWIAETGSLIDAAQRLNLAQSTVSKRILELEQSLGTVLLDRTGRVTRLSRAGRDLLPLAAEMLQLRLHVQGIASRPPHFTGAFRFGVTELVALTWLPKLIMAMRERFPAVIPEPEIGTSVALFHKLDERQLDLVIGLDPPPHAGLTTIALDSVNLRWMAAPGVGPQRDVVPLTEIAEYPILMQGFGSGLQRPVVDWLKDHGARLERIVKCNNLTVLSALAMAGLGVTFLTEQYFRPEIQSGKLRVITTDPDLPKIVYTASFRTDTLDPLAGMIAQLSLECCDFTVRGG